VKELEKRKIKVIRLEPFFEQDALGRLYDEVYAAKRRPHPLIKGFFIPVSTEADYVSRVVHDANCLRYIRDKLPASETEPFRARILFVTCDFRLSRVRKRIPSDFDFVITVAEFYEYMLPYLFLEDIMVAKPIEIPNFLLASTLSRELCASTLDFKSLFGTFLATSGDSKSLQDYKILSELSATERFRKVKEKHDALQGLGESEKLDGLMDTFLKSATIAFDEYLDKIKDSVAERLVQRQLFSIQTELANLKKDYELQKRKLELLEKKKKKSEKFKERQRRRSKRK
jgi:hypothetical protein